jgi:arylsulfatase A-like enzyme
VRRLAVVATALVLLGGAVGWWASREHEFRLPSRIRLTELVSDLSASLDPAAVVRQAPDAPVHIGGIQPTQHHGDVTGGFRRAIVAPAPSVLHFSVKAPAHAALEFAVGIQGSGQREEDASGVRFVVTLDGRQIYARVVNPAGTRRDRRWIEERVDLGIETERTVELTLATELETPGQRPAGTPGWSHVRIVEQSWRDRQVASAKAPSVLVVLIDTLRADRLGCYGASPSPSPNLDGLAKTGLVFERAIAQAPWTLPSVASIFTGLHPRSHGVIGSAPGPPRDEPDPAFLADVLPTLAVRAQEAGITTVGVSANPLVSRATNLARGFETFVEFSWNRTRNDWPHADEVNAPFFRWLAENRGRRFLAYLHYMEPHDPYTPPAAHRPAPPPGVRRAIAGDFHRLATAINQRRTTPLSPDELAFLRALYDAEIRSWDDAFAQVLAALDREGVRDSTVVLVTGDHGEEFQEHGRLKHRLQLYDESIHVPLVIAGPNLAARRIAAQAQGIDLFPTVAAILGAAAPSGLAGQNLLADRTPQPAFSETRYGIAPDETQTETVSLTTARWKLINAPAFGHFELYDLAHDPQERENRFASAPEGAELAARLTAWRAAAPPPPPTAGADPALREKLRALGYVD